jgi:hypothetical protein
MALEVTPDADSSVEYAVHPVSASEAPAPPAAIAKSWAKEKPPSPTARRLEVVTIKPDQ